MFHGKQEHTKNTQPDQNFTGSYKNSVEALDKLQYTQNIKRKKVNKLCKILFDQHQVEVEFKNQVCLREKEEFNNK